jgi:hypothetical protein
MSDREIIEEFAAMLRNHARAERAFIEKLVASHRQTQSALVEHLLDRLERLLELRRGPQPPPAPPPRGH